MKPLSRVTGICIIGLIGITIPILTLNEKNVNVVKTDTFLNSEIRLAKELTYVDDLVEEEIIEEPIIVYDNMTYDELVQRLNSILKNDLANMGEAFINYSAYYDVDLYMALSIVFLETGCNSGRCSTLVRSCNNVGGQKTGDSNKCGSGSYAKFSSLDAGIEAFYKNLSNNYIQKGLITPEQINTKYAESNAWASKVNNYIKYFENYEENI